MDDSHRLPTREEDVQALQARVAELEKAIRVLQDVHADAQMYLDVAGVLIMALDGDGRVKRVNRKIYPLLGFKEFEIVGKNFFELCLPAEKSGAIQKQYARFIQGNIKQFDGEWEWTILTKYRNERLMQWQGAPLFEESGNVCGLLASGEDITERRRSEQALRDSEQRYRTLFELNMDAVLIANVDGHVVDANSAAKEMLGYTLDELRAAGPHLGLNREDPAVAQAIKQRKNTGSFKGELTMSRKDGGRFLADISSHEYIDQNGEKRLSVLIRDISKRKQEEERVHSAEKMQSIKEMAQGFSHHINNLLTGIIGNLELAEMKPERQKEAYIHKAKSAAEHAVDMVAGLLSFSAHLKLRPQITDINRVVEAARQQSQPFLPEGLKIETQLEGHLPKVDVDRNLMQSVIAQLIHNAKDAIEECHKTNPRACGKIILATGVETRADSAGGRHAAETKPYVVVSVIDCGIGMDKATQKKLFSPFYTTKDIGHGIGLGLTGAYGIIKQHSGMIELESAPSQGTTARIFIPAAG